MPGYTNELAEMTLLQDRWKKIPGVQFHHLGQIQFRDTPEEYTLLQVNSERYTPTGSQSRCAASHSTSKSLACLIFMPAFASLAVSTRLSAHCTYVILLNSVKCSTNIGQLVQLKGFSAGYGVSPHAHRQHDVFTSSFHHHYNITVTTANSVAAKHACLQSNI